MAFDWKGLVTGLAQAAPVIAEQGAMRRQADALRRGQERVRARQDETDQRLSTELTDLARSNPEQERAEAMTDYVAALRRSRADVEGATPQVLGASDRYGTDVSTAREANADYGQRIAGLLSRIDAPARQRAREGFGAARTGIDIGQIANFARGDDFLARLRASRQQANPWVELLSRIAAQAAQNYQGEPPQPEQQYVDYSPRPNNKRYA